MQNNTIVLQTVFNLDGLTTLCSIASYLVLWFVELCQPYLSSDFKWVKDSASVIRCLSIFNLSDSIWRDLGKNGLPKGLIKFCEALCLSCEFAIRRGPSRFMIFKLYPFCVETSPIFGKIIPESKSPYKICRGFSRSSSSRAGVT